MGAFSVTEAFLQLTLSLLRNGLHTASLQVLCCCRLSTTWLSSCSHAVLYCSSICAGLAVQKACTKQPGTHNSATLPAGVALAVSRFLPELANASELLFQAYVAFVLSHIIPRHGRWPYRSGAQRWRISAAAFSVIHAALSEMPHQPSGAARGEHGLPVM